MSDNMDEIEAWVKLRNEALLSLDKDKILAVFKINNTSSTIPKDEKVFWAGVHYGRLGVPSFSNEVKQESRDWLTENGFRLHWCEL